MSTDPFSLVFDKLWELAEVSQPLMRLVSPGNLIKFNKAQDRDPLKQQILTADLPELVLTGVGSTEANLLESSCSSKIVRQYSFILSTGDYRITSFLLPVQFALFCALADYQAVLCPLQWKSKTFITQANWVSLSEGMSNPELNRGIKGWSSLWTCMVEMHFSTADLKAYNGE